MKCVPKITIWGKLMARSKILGKKREMPQSKGWEEESDRPKKRSCGSNAFSHFTRHLIGGIKKGLAGTKEVIDPTETLRLVAFYWNDLDAEWKQKFSQQPEIQRKEHSAISKPKPKKKTKQVQTCLRIRCSPKLLVSRNLQLTDDQKAAILNLNPFHSLLNGQCNCLNREFIMKLVDRFNPQTRTIEFRNGVRCKITEDDFARVLGMPKGDIAVPRECSQQHRNRIADWFEGECQQPEKALQLSVLGRVLGKKECDDQFQRAYMLFVLGCFLCPTTKDEVGSRLFPSVATDSLQRMKSYKWPQFLLDWLVEEVTSYKERRKSSRSSAGPGVGGCLFSLMIIYFDRFPKTVTLPEEGHPPIALWTKDLISKRIKIEGKDLTKIDSMLAQFPPHGLSDPGCIKVYKNSLRQFIENWELLKKQDARLTKKRKLKTHVQEEEEEKVDEEEKRDDDGHKVDEDEEQELRDNEDHEEELGDDEEDEEEEHGNDEDEEVHDEETGEEEDEEQERGDEDGDEEDEEQQRGDEDDDEEE